MIVRRLCVILCVLFLVACGSSPTAVPLPPNTPQPTAVPATQESLPGNTPTLPSTVVPTREPPTATLRPTAIAATPVPPSATSIPQPPVSNAIPVTFQPGGTSATVEGDLPANGSVAYALHLLGSRYFEASIESPVTQGSLGFYGADGTVLLSPAAGQQHWGGTIPSTQDYFVQVVSSGPASHYILSFVAPAPLVFAPGGTQLNVQGSVGPRQIQYYVMQAQAGQFAEVTIVSPNQGVLLSMYGIQDGQPIVRSAMGGSSYQGYLPATQQYMIQAVSSGAASNYNLQVIIPLRIQFAPGGTAATYNGAFSAPGTDLYILRAQAGQTLSVNITSPQNNVLLTVYGIQDGQPLIRSVSGATAFNGALPGTQDYMIEAVGIGPGAYTLSVSVQ